MKWKECFRQEKVNDEVYETNNFLFSSSLYHWLKLKYLYQDGDKVLSLVCLRVIDIVSLVTYFLQILQISNLKKENVQNNALGYFLL